MTDSVLYLSTTTRAMVESKESVLKKKQEEYERIQQEVQQLQNQYQVLNQERENERKKKEEWKEEEDQIETQIYSLRNRMQEIVQKRNNALSLLEEKRRDIGAISSIPSGAENYKNYSSNQLKTILNKANQHLLKYDKVNRKAMNQYLLFSERKKEFMNRNKELEEGTESIHSLIAVRRVYE